MSELSDDIIARSVHAYASTGSKQAAASLLGISEAAVRRHLTAAKKRGIVPEIEVVETPIEKPRVRVRAYSPDSVRDLPSRRVLVIGDTHRKPGMATSVMSYIGRYVADTKPDNVLHIGDFFDFESCELHSTPGSAAQITRPSFQDDISSGEDSLFEYGKEIAPGEIPHDIVLGNHDYRPERLEEASPNLAGTLTLLRDQFFARYRWRATPYKHWLFLEGVGFTHVPITAWSDKAYGGKTVERSIGNDATYSVVFGHTHRWNHISVPKIGVNNSITVTNVGCAMPYGYLPRYAANSTTGWTYGVADLRLRGGRVESANFISMLDLQERFS